jgi:hypothetical protein
MMRQAAPDVTDRTACGTIEPMHAPVTRVFYGWFVVAAAFAVTLVGFGSAYTFSAFVDSLQTQFGASRGSVSLVFSLAGFLYFSFGIVSGPLAIAGARDASRCSGCSWSVQASFSPAGRTA